MARLVQAVFAVGYLLMAVFGVWALLALPAAESDLDVDNMIFAGSLFTLIGVFGPALGAGRPTAACRPARCASTASTWRAAASRSP